MYSRKITRDGSTWEIPNCFYRISVKLLIMNDADELLVVQDTTNGTWEVPGGGLDHGESIHQTAMREIQEELGVELLQHDDEPIAITLGEHPNNYPTLMLYYRAKITTTDFTLEKKFKSTFVDEAAFLELAMLGDEAPIKGFAGRIWVR